jgi:hypothetical protein
MTNVPAASRALLILRTLAKAGAPMPAAAIATRVGIPQFEKEAYRKPEYAGVIGMMKAAIEDAPLPVRRPQGVLAWLKDMFRF